MEIKNIKLKKGVELTALTTDKFKSSILKVYLLTELKEETASHNSLLVDVMSASCEKYPELKLLNRKLAELYDTVVTASVSKVGEADALSFTVSFLDGKYAFDGTDLLKECCEMLGEIIFHPLVKDGAFDKAVVEREKKNLIDAIEAEKNNKSSYAVKRCIDVMCEGEAYSVSANGETEIVKNISAQELYEHYQKTLASAKVSVFYSGASDTDKVEEMVNRYLPFEERDENIKYADVIDTVGEVKNVTEEFPITQGKLSLGFRTGITLPDDDYYAYAVFNAVFGASPSSKLFMNVREKMSLCYYCRPVPDAHKGTLIVTSGININDKEKAQAAILDQLMEIQNGNITDEEIDNAKRFLKNMNKERYDSPSSLISSYFQNSLYSIYLSPDEKTEKIYAVEKDDIVKVSKKVILDTVYFMTGDGTEDSEDEE